MSEGVNAAGQQKSWEDEIIKRQYELVQASCREITNELNSRPERGEELGDEGESHVEMQV